jgi:hypothetical protein
MTVQAFSQERLFLFAMYCGLTIDCDRWLDSPILRELVGFVLPEMQKAGNPRLLLMLC